MDMGDILKIAVFVIIGYILGLWFPQFGRNLGL
jgi:hypothetical protein